MDESTQIWCNERGHYPALVPQLGMSLGMATSLRGGGGAERSAQQGADTSSHGRYAVD